jgi:protein TonB
MKTSETLLAADNKKTVPVSINKKNARSGRIDRKRKPAQAESGRSESAREKVKAGPNAPAEVAKSPYTGSGDGTETEIFGNLSGGEKSGTRLAGTPDGELDPSIELKSIDLFKAIVGSKIRSKVKYPQNCRRLGIEGSVRIKFEINSGGTAVGIEITRSSGNRDIDAAAVDAVKNGAPFLPYPRDISQKSLSFVLPLNFKLND